MARSSHIALKTFRVDWNGVSPDSGLPERLKILDWGVNKTLKGDVVVDDVTLALFDTNQKRMGRDTCYVDFNHATVQGTDAYANCRGDVPKIAGYFQPKVVKGEGVYMENVSTTPTGMKYAADFKDLSPTPFIDEKSNRLIGLHSVALTPTGAVDELTISGAAMKAMSATFKTLSSSLMDAAEKKKSLPAGYDNGQPDYYNDLDEELMTDENMKSLRTAMGVPDSMSWDELFPLIMAKIGSGKQGPITPDAANQVVKWPDGYKAILMAEIGKELEAKLTPLVASVEKLQTELAQKNADITKQLKDELITTATTEGKKITLSADIISSLDVKQLTAVIDALPKNVIPQKVTMRVLEAPRATKPTISNSARLIQEQINGVMASN